MQANFSDEFWSLLKGWYKSSPTIDPEEDKIWEEVTDPEEAYAAGRRDGKIELATDIMEHLDLINRN